MKDTIRVDHEMLRAAKVKYRRVVIDAEKGQANLHAAYKLGEFLSEALGVAWTAADDRMPDSVPE
jgi:hypothetical protein